MRARDGQTRKLEHVYLRGSQVKYIVLPDILTNAPIFKKIAAMRQSSAPSASAGRGAAKAKKPKKPKTG
jgi:small nuclear ribonucleoprotein D3